LVRSVVWVVGWLVDPMGWFRDLRLCLGFIEPKFWVFKRAKSQVCVVVGRVGGIVGGVGGMGGVGQRAKVELWVKSKSQDFWGPSI
jgi:hypothetical protein